ncbi:efflux transporter periplasmic adaptor subunit [Rhodovulum sulfidophilum]|uniref:Efflux RND transporter periplasmic adaptor subunit n=1 Tax=Rhodovulum visakhapatnamense TaxID=364297 RepID=A0ABS1REJ6_9RHOB|nr:efflux RND transporter periplasmic adaptor subunit [Rhodovulum visakhapatnamense]MBL3569166.1 efflux RND transporter periplasmic adaptor subunit [Rhodovulum visakhapatnamense]MBL3578058.1 efflux RND transporter periplasmic adaptor subunit [Rhodovulum visakhapatnamense]OLS44348.1 efflux transporter periplasmic adaptor subunit [Rhodovulum sulfidophilum]
MVRQIGFSVLLLAGTLALWIAFVPGARPVLDRLGVSALIGLDPAAPAGTAGSGARPGGPAAVTVSEVGEGRIQDRVAAIGDGRALRAVTVRSKVAGEVVEIGIRDGERVAAGALIVRLDDEAERIALDRAQLVLEDARDEADRVTRLETTGAVTEVRRREADLALRTAELELRQAEFDLSERTVRAPFAGWAGVLDIAVGDRVSSQDALATIADRSRILIDFHVPERVVGQIREGLPLTARPLGMPGLTLEGRVHAVDNAVDAASRTLRVQGELDNADDLLRGGMSFEVTLSFEGEPLPVVDPLSVQWSSAGAYVWAVRDGRAARVPVAIRQRNADSVLVEADLTVGEPVVVEGLQTLREGAELRIVGPQAGLGLPRPPGDAG